MNEEKQEYEQVNYSNHKPLKCWQKLLKQRHHYSQLPDRKLVTNLPDQELGDNEIQTSKYNLITFFPLNLMLQFTKPSNIYFLIIGILQIIPQITISEGKPTMFVPLTIVVVVSMIKDFIEDWRRRKNDKKENQSEVDVITEMGILKRKWSDIKVGQVIKVNKDQYFPCDTLILQHSQESNVAYVETKNLDGQNNLKLKKKPDCLSEIHTEDWLELSSVRYEVSYEKPNPFLNVFNGNMKVNKVFLQIRQKKYMLDNNNVILRGCSLKINEYVIGMCLYNGHESKILLNSANAKPKRSFIETYLNSYFKYIFIFQLCATLIRYFFQQYSATSYGIILATNYSKYTYFNEGKQFFIDTIFTWGSWFISFANFIPISLLVSLEVVRYAQGKLLESDEKCKSRDFNAEVQTSSVNDDLGQIEFILSDKTGTLTKNQMDFKFLYVNGVSYGENEFLRFDTVGDQSRRSHQDPQIQEEDIEESFQSEFNDEGIKQAGIKLKLVQELESARSVRGVNKLELLNKTERKTSKSIKESKTIYKGMNPKDILKNFTKIKHTNVDFPEGEKKRLLETMRRSSKDREAIKLALVHLAICHNVICEGEDYTSSSPDEVALVSFARYVGYKFLRKNQKNELEIEETLPGQKPKIIKYSLIHTLEFSSQRKRMSVIVKEIRTTSQKQDSTQKYNQSRVLLLCKGADDIILKKLSKSSKHNTDQKMKEVHDELFNYACKGLRTLVLAYRELEQNQFTEWDSKYNEALTIVSSTRYDKVCELQAQIEQEMHFVGVTAIEDKLQDEVKQTIYQLKKSNIKVWMLTGDKKQTAISIGYSCGLIDPTNQIITLDCEIQHAKDLIKNVKEMLHIIPEDKVTVLSGEFIMGLDDAGKQMLGEILKQSVSVICCRVSPKGKEEITSIVKKWGRTLAIGDGANDVNMINSAHIGVGVRGIQGSQATRAADYVISQFKHLKRLVLFYGINFYHRNCGVILFTLYKNIFVTFPILFYGPLSVQSAVFIYEMWIFQFYNILFTALPIIYFGLFDTIYSEKQMITKPYLYSEGQKGEYFNKWILLRQIFTTIVSSVFLVLTSFQITNQTILGNGLIAYESWTGMFIFNVVVITVNIRIWNMSNQISILQALMGLFSISTYYLTFFLLEILFYTEVKNTLTHQVSTWLYWILIILYSFAIEGLYHIVNRVNYLYIKIKQVSDEKLFKRDVEMKFIRRQTLNLDEIDPQKRASLGGYAFAQDQQRSMQMI